MPNQNLPITWLISFKLPYLYLKHFISYLGEIYSDISYFEHKTGQYMESKPDDIWIVQIHFARKPTMTQVIKQVENAAKINIIYKPPKLKLTNLKDRDWVAEIKRKSKPIIVGKFCIYNSHHKIKQNNLIPIVIDPTRAFGSGEHYTTKNCIKALCYLKEEKLNFNKMLDIGCGSGILAITMAKLWQKPVIATDIDKQSFIIATENIIINQVDDLVKINLADGYTHQVIKANAPYDLITCNILAHPLILMAKDLTCNLRPKGMAILAGFLINQEQEVINAHLAHNLRVIYKITDNNWCIIILEKS